MFYEPTMSLHDNLAANGFTHHRIGNSYAHAIYCGEKLIYRGDAVAVAEWLKQIVEASHSLD